MDFENQLKDPNFIINDLPKLLEYVNMVWTFQARVYTRVKTENQIISVICTDCLWELTLIQPVKD